MSLQLRFLYDDETGNRVYGNWYDIGEGQYYYTNPELDGWKVTVQVRETDGLPPPQPDSKRSRRKAAQQAVKYRVTEGQFHAQAARARGV